MAVAPSLIDLSWYLFQIYCACPETKFPEMRGRAATPGEGARSSSASLGCKRFHDRPKVEGVRADHLWPKAQVSGYCVCRVSVELRKEPADLDFIRNTFCKHPKKTPSTAACSKNWRNIERHAERRRFEDERSKHCGFRPSLFWTQERRNRREQLRKPRRATISWVWLWHHIFCEWWCMMND